MHLPHEIIECQNRTSDVERRVEDISDVVPICIVF